ncbi:MAG TPA: MMPL family transporter, partial [Acidimicrobiales bacterium]|nr:MMPL family transporter [Acidimicrobiales bacterium]
MTIAPRTAIARISPSHLPSTVLGRIADRVLRHRRLVLVFWLVVLLAGGMAASRVSNRLSVDFSLPGQPGYETGLKILNTFGNGGENSPSILVATLPAGQKVQQHRAALAQAFDTIRSTHRNLRVVDYASTNDKAFVTNDGRSTFAYVFEPLPKTFGTDTDATSAQATLQRALPGDTVGLTGLDQLEAGGSSKGPGVLLETVVGGLGALAVLAFVFASFLALLPLLIAIVSILATFLVILILTYITDVSFIVEFLVALVGLGIAIDYSLLLVTRWREECARGLDNHDAVVRAVETAGRAVVLSGLTVAIGLVALVVLPVPGLRSTGIGGMLIPLISIIVVITLLPALLGGVGPRIDWPRIRHENHASRGWTAWARGVTRRRFGAMALAIAVLVLAIIPIFGLKVGATSADALSKTGSARSAYDVLGRGGVPSGVLTPIEVLTHFSSARSTVEKLRRVDGIT